MDELMIILDKAFSGYQGNLDVFSLENKDSIAVLDNALRRGYAKREDMECLQDLYDSLDEYIRFKSDRTTTISDYL